MPPQARPGRAGHSPAFRATVVRAILAGLPHRDVARRYGVSTATIAAWCKAAGVPKVKGVPPTCHPDRPAFGRGFCQSCYGKMWRRGGFVDTAVVLKNYLRGKAAPENGHA